jgi:putative membrane protein
MAVFFFGIILALLREIIAMNYIIKILLTAIAVFVIANILPGVSIESYFTSIIVAVIIGLLDSLVKPILIILTIPITIITLGLFLFIINALIILIADYFISGFGVGNIIWAAIFSILVSLLQSILYKILDK